MPRREFGRNMDVKGDSGEDSEQESCLQESHRESHLLREYINHREQIVAGNMNAKGASWEFSSGNEEHVICNWRKGDPCNEVGENLADCVLLDGR